MSLFLFSFVQAVATKCSFSINFKCLQGSRTILLLNERKKEWHFVGCNFKIYLFCFTFYKMHWQSICVLSTYSLKSPVRFPALDLLLAVVYGIPYNFFFPHKMTAVLFYIRMHVLKWERFNFFCLFFMQWQAQFLMNKGKIWHCSLNHQLIQY